MAAERIAAGWNRQLVRGCLICRHGHGAEDERVCTCAQVTGHAGRVLPVHAARANAGPCGPEATHMDFPGLAT